jgi:hypothetical protein
MFYRAGIVFCGGEGRENLAGSNFYIAVSGAGGIDY